MYLVEVFMSGSNVFLVLQMFADETIEHGVKENFEIQGVFSTEEKALEAALGYESDLMVIGRVEQDKALPEERCEWPWYWYPKLEDRSEADKRMSEQDAVA